MKAIVKTGPFYKPNAPNTIGGWGSAPDPAGGAYDAPPDPLIVRGFAPLALALAPSALVRLPEKYTPQHFLIPPKFQFLDKTLSARVGNLPRRDVR